MKKYNVAKLIISLQLVLGLTACAGVSLSSRGEKVNLVGLESHSELASCKKYEKPIIDVVGESENQIEDISEGRQEKLFKIITNSMRNEAGKLDLNLCISDMKLHIFQRKMKTEAEINSIFRNDPFLRQVIILGMASGHAYYGSNTVYMSATCYKCLH